MLFCIEIARLVPCHAMSSIHRFQRAARHRLRHRRWLDVLSAGARRRFDKFPSSFKVFQINFSKWMNAIYYSMKRDLNAESRSTLTLTHWGLYATFVIADARRKHIVCCRWSHKNLVLFRMRILTWNERNENTNLEHCRSRASDVHAIEKNAFMQWLLSRGTIVLHHWYMYRLFIATRSEHSAQRNQNVRSIRSFMKSHMQIITTAKPAAAQRSLFHLLFRQQQTQPPSWTRTGQAARSDTQHTQVRWLIKLPKKAIQWELA